MIRNAFLFAAIFMGATSQAHAEQRDIHKESVGIAIGREEKTVDPRFEGTKVLLDLRYTLRNEKGDELETRKCCTLPSMPEQMWWMIDTGLRWAPNDGGLEYVRIGVTPWALELTPGREPKKALYATYDILALGTIKFLRDEPLEVDSYLQIDIGRAGRHGELKWSPDSPFTLKGGVESSVGWAWAESENDAYDEVSNPFIGFFLDLSLVHERWGEIYAVGRFINGFSFSSPQRGHPTAREARARFGYAKALPGCMEIDAFLEKRSFYFDDSVLPGLYTKSGTVAAQLNCHFD